MKKFSLILCVILLLSLCGCQKPTPSAPAATTTAAATDAVLPPATEPPATESLGEHTENPAPDVTVLTAQVPFAAGPAETAQLVTEEGEGYSAEYWKFVNAAGVPFDGKVVYVCTDEQEMMSGSSYDLFVWEDGALKQLQEKTFSRTYTILGQSVRLEFPYAEYDGKVYYAKASTSKSPQAFLQDGSRGVHNCLIYFETTGVYYGIVDLETGKLTDLMAGCDPELLKGSHWNLRLWGEDNTLILQSGETKWLSINGADGKVSYYDLTTLIPGLKFGKSAWFGDGVAFYGTPEGKNRATYYKVLFGEQEPTVLVEDVIASTMEPYWRYSMFMDEDFGRHVLDLQTGTTVDLPENYRLRTWDLGDFVLCVDPDGGDHLLDMRTGQLRELHLPEGWSGEHFGASGLSEGEHLIESGSDKDRGVSQLLIYHTDTDKFTLLEVTLETAEGYTNWTKLPDGRFCCFREWNEYFLFDIDLP